MKSRPCWLFNSHFEFMKCRQFFFFKVKDNILELKMFAGKDKENKLQKRTKIFIYFRNWEIRSRVLSRRHYIV